MVLGIREKNKVAQNYPSFKQKNVSTPPGGISKISVAIAINRSLPAGVSMKQLREGIAAITSPNSTVDDIRITVAEFARAVPQKAKALGKPLVATPDLTNIFNKVFSFLKGLPLWANITIAILGFIILLNSLKRPAVVPQPSTVSQINQSRQNQFQKPPDQIAAEKEAAPVSPAKGPDISNILSGLKEAASERPEYLASKLQIWLEEGIPAG